MSFQSGAPCTGRMNVPQKILKDSCYCVKTPLSERIADQVLQQQDFTDATRTGLLDYWAVPKSPMMSADVPNKIYRLSPANKPSWVAGGRTACPTHLGVQVEALTAPWQGCRNPRLQSTSRLVEGLGMSYENVRQTLRVNERILRPTSKAISHGSSAPYPDLA